MKSNIVLALLVVALLTVLSVEVFAYGEIHGWCGGPWGKCWDGKGVEYVGPCPCF